VRHAGREQGCCLLDAGCPTRGSTKKLSMVMRHLLLDQLA
jgi:hypothetical protein